MLDKVDTRRSTARLSIMIHPPFHATTAGVLASPDNIVLAGLNDQTEMLILELATIWKAEQSREARLNSRSLAGYEWLLPIHTQPLPVTIVGRDASKWFKGIQVNHGDVLSDLVLQVKTIDHDPRYISSSAINQLVSEQDARIYYSIEGEHDYSATLRHLHSICNRGSIVCISSGHMPINVIAIPFSIMSQKQNVFVKSFSLMDSKPPEEVLDGSLWDRLAYDLHVRVYDQDPKSYSQTDNLPAVIRYPFLLASVGCHIVSVNETSLSDTSALTEHNVNVIQSSNLASHLAKLEHTRWCRESLAAGKIYGPTNGCFDNVQTRMSLKPWESLTQTDVTTQGDGAIKSTMNHCCELGGFPGIMAKLGLAIQPDECTPFSVSGTHLPLSI
jgi:hypothetical protein